MKRMTTSRREDPESEPEKSPNKGLECNCHPRHGSCVRTSRATGASPLSPDDPARFAGRIVALTSFRALPEWPAPRSPRIKALHRIGPPRRKRRVVPSGERHVGRQKWIYKQIARRCKMPIRSGAIVVCLACIAFEGLSQPVFELKTDRIREIATAAITNASPRARLDGIELREAIATLSCSPTHTSAVIEVTYRFPRLANKLNRSGSGQSNDYSEITLTMSGNGDVDTNSLLFVKGTEVLTAQGEVVERNDTLYPLNPPVAGAGAREVFERQKTKVDAMLANP
jgi:hypothetical protein